jgi:hypothetical protein
MHFGFCSLSYSKNKNLKEGILSENSVPQPLSMVNAASDIVNK